MPIIPGASTPFVDQNAQTEMSPSTQSRFRQMVGELCQWRPDIPVTIAEKFIQNAYRAIIDERLWSGLLQRGVISVPNMTTLGQVNVTNSSKSVLGINTAWDDSIVGLQFRIGFSTPIYTIVAVTDATHLQLELPFGSPTLNGVTYTIFQQLVSFGPNLKRVKTVLNQQQGYRLILDRPVQDLDAVDTWRTQVGYTRFLCDREMNRDGESLFELYPIPTVQQAFPFSAYYQPPDLSDANDYAVAWIPSDLIVIRALSDALLFRGVNKDPQTAAWKRKEYQERLERVRVQDDSLDLKDLEWDYSQFPVAQGGMWAQEHDF